MFDVFERQRHSFTLISHQNGHFTPRLDDGELIEIDRDRKIVMVVVYEGSDQDDFVTRSILTHHANFLRLAGTCPKPYDGVWRVFVNLGCQFN